MTSNKTLKDWLLHFKLDRVYDIDTEKSLCTNIKRLCQLMSCLQPTRIFGYDGKHRFYTICLAAMGYHGFSNRATVQLAYNDDHQTNLQEAAHELGIKFDP